MNIRAHAIQGAVAIAALYPVIHEKAFIVGVSVVGIDADHYIQYVWDTGKWGPRGMFRHFGKLQSLLKGHLLGKYLDLSIFHTIECYFALLALGKYVHEDFNYVLIGFMFHHLLDYFYFSFVINWHWGRAFSVVEYYIRKKGRYTSLNQVLQARGEREE